MSAVPPGTDLLTLTPPYLRLLRRLVIMDIGGGSRTGLDLCQRVDILSADAV